MFSCRPLGDPESNKVLKRHLSKVTEPGVAFILALERTFRRLLGRTEAG